MRILCIILFLFLAFTVAADDNSTAVCVPFGSCEPCPPDALHQPYCQPYGNRRLVHCSNSTSLPHSNPNTRPTPRPPNERTPGETPAWESCGRISAQESADFWEFVACNVLFAVISLFVLFARSRRLQAMQARQLAARIGLIRGGAVR